MGGNLLLDGVPQLSMLPARTLLFFEGGVTLKVDGQNGPCKATGRSIAEHGGAGDATFDGARFRQGGQTVARASSPGSRNRVRFAPRAERFKARLPEQWINA